MVVTYFGLRGKNEYYIVWPFSGLVRLAAKDPELWQAFPHRVKLIRHMERIAIRIERIPRSTGVSDPYVLKQLVDRANERAAVFRRLQTEIAMPDSDTYDILQKELAERFVLVLNGQWYEMPRVDLTDAQKPIEAHKMERTGRRRVVISIPAAIVFLSLAILSITKLGSSTATLTVPFLLSSAITILGSEASS